MVLDASTGVNDELCKSSPGERAAFVERADLQIRSMVAAIERALRGYHMSKGDTGNGDSVYGHVKKVTLGVISYLNRSVP